MKTAAIALGLALLAGCGSEEPPDVDWSQIPSSQRALIDEAVDAGDCEQMQTYFDGSESADVLSYLDWHMRDAGCY